jgi:hypothetical protein
VQCSITPESVTSCCRSTVFINCQTLRFRDAKTKPIRRRHKSWLSIYLLPKVTVAQAVSEDPYIQTIPSFIENMILLQLSPLALTLAFPHLVLCACSYL